MGSSRVPLWFSGKLGSDISNFYMYPQSLVKQFQVEVINEPLKYYEFDIVIEINYGKL